MPEGTQFQDPPKGQSATYVRALALPTVIAEALLRLGDAKGAAPHRKSWLEGADEPDETFLLKRAAAAKSRIAYGPASDEEEDDL